MILRIVFLDFQITIVFYIQRNDFLKYNIFLLFDTLKDHFPLVMPSTSASTSASTTASTSAGSHSISAATSAGSHPTLRDPADLRWDTSVFATEAEQNRVAERQVTHLAKRLPKARRLVTTTRQQPIVGSTDVFLPVREGTAAAGSHARGQAFFKCERCGRCKSATAAAVRDFGRHEWLCEFAGLRCSA